MAIEDWQLKTAPIVKNRMLKEAEKVRCDFPTDDLQELLAYSVLFTDAEYKPALSLFHYTSASNLNSIIKSDYLGFTEKHSKVLLS